MNSYRSSARKSVVLSLPSAGQRAVANYQLLRLEFISVIVRYQLQEIIRWECFLVGNACGGNGLRPERPFTGVSGPCGPKIAKKSPKESFWGSAKKSPRIPEKVKKYPKNPIWGVFYFFGYFQGPFCRPPERLFWRLFCDFGPGGPGDSCKWSLGSQAMVWGLVVMKTKSQKGRTSRRPSRGGFSSWRLSVMLPFMVLPLILSPTNHRRTNTRQTGQSWRGGDMYRAKCVKKIQRAIGDSFRTLKKRLLQKSEGNLSKQVSGWILQGILFVDFVGPVSLQKKQEKKKIHSKIQIRIWELRQIYTEQMDAEGLGRKLLLTSSGDPRRAPEKQTVGTVTASHKILTLQALSSSLKAGTAKRGCLRRGEAFGCPPAVCPPKRRPFAHYRINNFLTSFAGQLSQRRTPPVPGKNGTKLPMYNIIKQNTAGLSQGRSQFVPQTGSRLSQGRVPFVLDTVPPKMFMFIPWGPKAH